MASSMKRRVLLGIRIVCIPAVLWVTYYDYRREGFIGIVGNLAMYAVIAALSYSKFQGKTLAEENMTKYGLEPDRDEAPPSA
jgi:hypothetical protein